MRVDDVLSDIEDADERSALKSATDWLEDYLREGAQGVKEIKRESEDAGIPWMTVRRAADRLHVKKRKKHDAFHAGWSWEL
jgi:hypothetical protein